MMRPISIVISFIFLSASSAAAEPTFCQFSFDGACLLFGAPSPPAFGGSYSDGTNTFSKSSIFPPSPLTENAHVNQLVNIVANPELFNSFGPETETFNISIYTGVTTLSGSTTLSVNMNSASTLVPFTTSFSALGLYRIYGNWNNEFRSPGAEVLDVNVTAAPPAIVGVAGGTPQNPDPGTTLPRDCQLGGCGTPAPPVCDPDNLSCQSLLRQIQKLRENPPTKYKIKNVNGGGGVLGQLGLGYIYYVGSVSGDDFIYEISPGEANFSTVTLSADANADFTLVFFDGSPNETLAPGQTIAFAGAGESAFALEGDPSGYSLGLTFATTDPSTIGPVYEAAFSQIPEGVPEPSSLWLLGSALAGVAAMRPNQRRTRSV